MSSLIVQSSIFNSVWDTPGRYHNSTAQVVIIAVNDAGIRCSMFRHLAPHRERLQPKVFLNIPIWKMCQSCGCFPPIEDVLTPQRQGVMWNHYLLAMIIMILTWRYYCGCEYASRTPQEGDRRWSNGLTVSYHHVIMMVLSDWPTSSCWHIIIDLLSW